MLAWCEARGVASRPHYLWSTFRAARTARDLGHEAVSVVEFGVAGGNGLLALEIAAEQAEAVYGIRVDVHGFDTGSGMPEPKDHRDVPWVIQPGFFPMDEQALRARLRRAALVLGPIAETLPAWLRESHAPVGFVAVDVDYYSSTVDVLGLFDASPERVLPRVVCYFDDVLGFGWSDFNGERAAIAEFNEAHHERKIGQVHGLRWSLPPSARELPWPDQMYVAHLFDHPRYDEPEGTVAPAWFEAHRLVAGGGGDQTGDLAEPMVPAGAYDEHYYRNWCAGFEEWTASDGSEMAGLYPGSLRRARLQPDEVVVDIGTGRGELLAAAVEAGARRAIGVEYSPAAVELARKTLAVRGVDDRAEVVQADARAIPVDDVSADLVTMLDVVEHLAPDELDGALREAHRILRPGGRVFIHTLPNRTVYDVTYRLQRLLWPPRWRSWPADPRQDIERLMHVNEQTATSLERALRRAGFEPRVTLGEWILDHFVPEGRPRKLYPRLARHRLTERLGAADLWAEGRKTRQTADVAG